MTREQAIKELTELLPEEFLSEYTDAIKMGIEALERNQCGDCISREVVIKTIAEWLFSKEFHYTNATEYLRNRLDELPSVTPQPKMGRWTRELIRNEYGGCIGAKMICSECEQDNGYDKRMKFCPNCGAKMQEVEE